MKSMLKSMLGDAGDLPSLWFNHRRADPPSDTQMLQFRSDYRNPVIFGLLLSFFSVLLSSYLFPVPTWTSALAFIHVTFRKDEDPVEEGTAQMRRFKREIGWHRGMEVRAAI